MSKQESISSQYTRLKDDGVPSCTLRAISILFVWTCISNGFLILVRTDDMDPAILLVLPYTWQMCSAKLRGRRFAELPLLFVYKSNLSAQDCESWIFSDFGWVFPSNKLDHLRNLHPCFVLELILRLWRHDLCKNR